MGKPSPEETDRNLEIYRLHKTEGLSGYKIAPRYGLTSARIYAIIEQVEKKLKKIGKLV